MKDLVSMHRIVILSLILLAEFSSSISYADDATVLPKKRWRIQVDSNLSLPIDKRYDENGDVVDLGTDYNEDLDSTLLPALSVFDPIVGGTATLGQSVVSMTRNVRKVTIQPAYGVTDKLSIGMNIPFWWVKQDVTASVDATGANVGLNSGFACGAPVCPLFVPGTVAVTTEDIQNLLGAGVDVDNDGAIDVPGFGFERFESWNGSGIGDIEAGAKYQYFKSEDWRLAFLGGVRFPTGSVDDPNNLTDYGWGNGAYSLLFQFNQDYMVGPPGVGKDLGIPEPGTFFINTTVRYDLIFPDHENLRVCSITNPVCPDEDNVDRNLGDIIQGEISAKIGFLTNGLTFSPLYMYGHQFKGTFSGDKGFDYSVLITESDATEQIYMLTLSYSTLPMFMDRQFPVPLNASISFRDRFAGDNHYTKAQFLGFQVQVYL